MTQQKIYLDNAATTPLDKRVFAEMLPYFDEFYGNPSAIHSFGQKTRAAIEESRDICANAINADSSEIYFTSGGTESINYILQGLAKIEKAESGRTKILSSKTEHKAVLQNFEFLEKEGFVIDLVDVNNHSSAILYQIEKKIDSETNLISFMHTNNETGSINDIESISKIAKERKVHFFSDSVQAFGKLDIDVNRQNLSAISVSAHKFGGPKGVGFAYIKNGTPMTSFILGGGQERNRRGGTEDVPGIIGMASAIKLAIAEKNQTYDLVKNLRQRFINNLLQIGAKFKAFDGENFSPFILSLSFSPEFYRLNIDSILMYLDSNGLAVSAGSACTSGTIKHSHVILSSGRTPEEAAGTIRISFWKNNTIEEIDIATSIIEKLLIKIKKG